MDLFPGDVIVIPSDPPKALMMGGVEEIYAWALPHQVWLDKKDDY